MVMKKKPFMETEVIRVNGTREETVTQAVTENFNKTYDLTVKRALKPELLIMMLRTILRGR